uniref:Ig-like domain-containing protein n=1 Tax=Cyprinus carpio TaxID=7962 RepID=A0A8C2EXZ4_CYPCA
MFLCFAFCITPVCSSGKRYLHFKFTVLSKADTFPEFSAVAVADDIQIKHYSNEERYWILTEDDWINAPEEPPDSRDWFLHQIRTLSDFINYQACYDISLNLRAFDEYGFDGEDFMAFDSETLQWIDKHPKAKETKMKWDQQTERNEHLKQYLKTCTDWISTFNNTEKRKPDVHTTLRKDPNDQNKEVLTCLTTGFYPRDIEMDIRFNKTALEDQISSGIRPNDDGSFQMRSSVEIDRNHEGIYDCFVIHRSLTEPVSAGWSKYQHKYSLN